MKNTFASLIALSVCAAPAMAGGLEGSYAGAGVAVGIDGEGTAASISGRYDVPTAPVSIRPQFTVGEERGGNLSLTADLPVADGLTVYAGGGASFGAETVLNGEDDIVGFAVVGAEGAIAEQVVLFGDVKFGLGNENTYVPTLGVAYKF